MEGVFDLALNDQPLAFNQSSMNGSMDQEIQIINKLKKSGHLDQELVKMKDEIRDEIIEKKEEGIQYSAQLFKTRF